MSDYAALARSLSESLHLTQSPIAISFADTLPPGVKTFNGSVPAGCRFWQEAAKAPFATVTSDHELCSIGIYTHNLDMSTGAQTDLGDALKVFGDLGYV